MRLPSAITAAIIGATGTFCLSYQSSALRLIGQRPNDDDVHAAKRNPFKGIGAEYSICGAKVNCILSFVQFHACLNASKHGLEQKHTT
eukprot:768455-Hanusia_phi.AAC.1